MDTTQLGLLRNSYVERINQVEVFEMRKPLDGNFSVLLLQHQEDDIFSSDQLAEALVAERAVACSIAVKQIYIMSAKIFSDN